jgi:RNA polymerase sigma-70 factor, ECF subfamily
MRGSLPGSDPRRDRADPIGPVRELMSDPRRQAFSNEALIHLPELLRVATRLLQDRAAAEDAVQETYLEAWRSFGSYELGTNCRAWLYRILQRTMARGRRRERPMEELAEVADPHGPAERGEDILASRRLRSAYAELSAEAQQMLVLADVEGYKYREIAELLEVPIGTVMSRLSRARESLRRRILASAAAPTTPARERANARWRRD